MQIFDDEVDNKSITSNVESVEIGKILTSSLKWKAGKGKFLVTWLNDGDKARKLIYNYLDAFINNSLNYLANQYNLALYFYLVFTHFIR